MAGLNVRANIFRMTTMTDDTVGGAMMSGTIAYYDVQARFQASPVQQLLLQQGLETTDTFTATIIPGTLDIRERDEFQLSKPTDHHYYNQRFRIVGVRYSDFNPRNPNNYLMLTLIRRERAHSEQ